MAADKEKKVVYIVNTGWGLPEYLPISTARLFEQSALVVYQPGTEPIIDEFVSEQAIALPLQPAQHPTTRKRLARELQTRSVVMRLLLAPPSEEDGLIESEAQLWHSLGFETEYIPSAQIRDIVLSLLDLQAQQSQPHLKSSIRILSRHEAIRSLAETQSTGQTSWLVLGRSLFAGLRVGLGSSGEIQEQLKDGQWVGPIAVVGPLNVEAAKLLRQTHQKSSLLGQRIVITRTRAQARPLVQILRARGALTLVLPSIRIQSLAPSKAFNEALSGLNSYDWVIFTSPNGARIFFQRFFERFSDARDFGGARIAAVGPATAHEVRNVHLSVDLVPTEGTAESIARELSDYMSLENLRILIVRGERATPELPMILEEKGAIVDQVVCYRTIEERSLDPIRIAWLRRYGADWILFFSGSAVESFNRRINLVRMRQRFPKLKIGVMGPQARHALERIGLRPDVEASVHTIDGLVTAIEQAVAQMRQL